MKNISTVNNSVLKGSVTDITCKQYKERKSTIFSNHKCHLSDLSYIWVCPQMYNCVLMGALFNRKNMQNR